MGRNRSKPGYPDGIFVFGVNWTGSKKLERDDPNRKFVGFHKRNRPISSIDSLFHEHLDKKLTRREAADVVHLHPVYMDRAFEEIYGMTPMKMLLKIRLRRAEQLIETTNWPLSLIAEHCGLGDAPYMNRLFRKYTKTSPGLYRKNAKLSNNYYLIEGSGPTFEDKNECMCQFSQCNG